MKPRPAPFGGGWTKQKLKVLRKYLSAYTTALKRQPFKTAYIDAFAGTGYRELKDDRRGSKHSTKSGGLKRYLAKLRKRSRSRARK